MARWTGQGTIIPGVLAHLEQLSYQGDVAGHERGTVAGEVGLLGQRVHREQPLVAPTAYRGVEDARHWGVRPAQLGVALVGGHHDAVGAGPGHDLGQVRRAEDRAGGVARAVEPEQLRPGRGGLRTVGREAVDDHRGRASEPGTDVVGGVGDRGDADDVARAEAEERRQPGDQLLAAHGRQHAVGVDAGDAPSAGEPTGDRLAQIRRPPRLRVAGRIRCRRQRLAHQGGRRVHRRAHGQVDDPLRVRLRDLLVRLERVPREVGELRAELAAHSSCSCGGSASMIGWSLAMMPILAAPPGLPRSSKNSTLAL